MNEVISLNKSIGAIPPDYNEASIGRRSPDRLNSRTTIEDKPEITRAESKVLATITNDDMRTSRINGIIDHSRADSKERILKSESRVLTEGDKSRMDTDKDDPTADLSADKLKERYDSREAKTFEDLARNASPSRRRQLTELVSSLEREAAATSFQRAEIEHLKNVILGLDTKLKQMTIIKSENDRLKVELLKNEEARKDLQHSIAETTNELKQEIANMQQQVNELIKQKEDLLRRNDDLMGRQIRIFQE